MPTNNTPRPLRPRPRRVVPAPTIDLSRTSATVYASAGIAAWDGPEFLEMWCVR